MYLKNKNVDNSAFVSKRISIADIMSVNISKTMHVNI